MEQRIDLVRDLGPFLASVDMPLSELRLSSAYTSRQGTLALRSLVSRSERQVAILGCNAMTEWEAMEQLADWSVPVQVMPDPPSGLFHPKCLYAELPNGRAWVLAGSANLTEGGLSLNIEVGVHVEGTRSMPVMRETRKLFDDLSEVAAPLTPEVLEQLREEQSEIRRSGAWRDIGLAAAAGLDPVDALRLTPAGQAVVVHLNVRRLWHYIWTTKMEASYKMVILSLLLQSEEGWLDLMELAKGFHRFYELLVMGEIAPSPERAIVGMAMAVGMKPGRVLEILKGAPREALSRSGLVTYTTTEVWLSRTVWEAMTPSDRERARSLAIGRLEAYYKQHLGVSADFGSLLTFAGLYRGQV